MEGFDNEVEKATPRGCSAAKQRSADSNTAEKRKPPIEEGFHPYNNISAMRRVSPSLLRIENPYTQWVWIANPDQRHDTNIRWVERLAPRILQSKR